MDKYPFYNKYLALATIILTAIGAINWGLVGAFNLDLVAAIFSSIPVLANIIYIE